MNEQKKGFMNWVKAHKKELIIAGISLGAIIAVVCCYRKRESIGELWETLKNAISKLPSDTFTSEMVIENINETAPIDVDKFISTEAPVILSIRAMPEKPFDVSEHIRNLPDGWHASAEKIATAAEHGYQLLPGQTLVENYTKNMMVA